MTDQITLKPGWLAEELARATKRSKEFGMSLYTPEPPLKKCTYADAYLARFEPHCGCQMCWDKWEAMLARRDREYGDYGGYIGR